MGQKRLEEAIKVSSDRFSFEVKWLPYFLDISLPESGITTLDWFKSKFAADADVYIKKIKESGEKEGFPISYKGEAGNTTNSHRLVEYAYPLGKQNEVVKELFKNYFLEDKNIANIDVLTEAAKAAGLDAAKAREFLLSGEGKQEVIATAAKLKQQHGVSKVPFFILNNKIELQGLQETEDLISAINRASE